MEIDLFEQLRIELTSWLQDRMPGVKVTTVHSPLLKATAFRIEYEAHATIGLSDGLDLTDPVQVEQLYPVLLSELTRATENMRMQALTGLGIEESSVPLA